ncbi:AAA family ATPase [uncultured Bacteroides sp.]|uniref:AAA family ATPase n=1 Tax=uncultured Bacteroides sp. TaxID=162156 RepID=UPI00280B5C8F|nr:AAA family ATPase [uncultured Bacteroides sp.]
MRHITITGSLGSGKSVVSSILKDHLGLEIESIGSLLRKMAQKYGMSTIDFNKYMETHPEFDHELDDLVKKQGLSVTPKIFDSRLAWHFIPQSFKVYLYVEDEIAAKRVFNDSRRINEKYSNVQVAKLNIVQRRNSEVHRFKVQYNVDLEDLANYDLIIDTSYSTPTEIANIIISIYKQKSDTIKKEIWLSPYTLKPTQGIRNHSIDKINCINTYFEELQDYIQNPIKIMVYKNQFYVYDGHKRVLNSIINQISLLPCELMNISNNKALPFGQTVEAYIKDCLNDEIYCDWIDLINYLKNEGKWKKK